MREFGLDPSLKVEHSAEDEFPNSAERESLGFEPFDLFLFDSEQQAVFSDSEKEGQFLKPRLYFAAGSVPELKDELSGNCCIAFRYARKGIEEFRDVLDADFEPSSNPPLQTEVYPASISLNADFEKFLNILDRSIQGHDLDVTYNLRPQGTESVNSYTQLSEYIESISEGSFNLWSDNRGLRKLETNPSSMQAKLWVYTQDVDIYNPDDINQFRGQIAEESQIEETDKGQRLILNYEDEEINSIEESLDRHGFTTTKKFVPDSLHPINCG